MGDPAGAPVVSSESERLILVDSQDNEIGFETKGAAHDGDGILHRAFSLFIFNSKGELLDTVAVVRCALGLEADLVVLRIDEYQPLRLARYDWCLSRVTQSPPP